MPPISHMLAGWCCGNVPALDAKQRFACMMVSLAPDVDAISMFWGGDAYISNHHILAHNLVFGVVISAVATLWLKSGTRLFLILLTLFHLHLIMDLFGSGVGWGIAYLWPFSALYITIDLAWDFAGWQNYAFFTFLAVWTVAIALKLRRTPLEWVTPRLDGLILRSHKNAP